MWASKPMPNLTSEIIFSTNIRIVYWKFCMYLEHLRTLQNKHFKDNIQPKHDHRNKFNYEGSSTFTITWEFLSTSKNPQKKAFRRQYPTKARPQKQEVQPWRKLHFYKHMCVPLTPYASPFFFLVKQTSIPNSGVSNSSQTWYSPSNLTLIVTPMTSFKVFANVILP